MHSLRMKVITIKGVIAMTVLMESPMRQMEPSEAAMDTIERRMPQKAHKNV